MRTLRVLPWAAVLWIAGSGPVQAGPLEETIQVATNPADPDQVVLRYVNGGHGLVLSHDGGESWSTLCASAILAPTMERPPSRLQPVAIASDGTLFMGAFQGLMFNTAGDGCDWEEDPTFDGAWVTDLVHDPVDSSVLYAITSTDPDGTNAMFRRVGSGAWEQLGSETEANLSRVRVVALPGDGRRIYQSIIDGQRGEPGMQRPNYVIRYSDDLGETWEAFEYGDTDGKLWLEAVDPTNPDRIIVSIERDLPESGGGSVPKDPDSVMVSSDRGASFTEYLQITVFGGVDLADDGRVWIGDRGDSFRPDDPHGLYLASSLDEAATQVDDALNARCIQLQGEQVFVCQPFEAGVVETDGSGYVKRFDYREVPSFISCEGRDLVEECRQQMLTAWCGISHFPEAPMCCPYPDRVTNDPNLVPGEEVPTVQLDCPEPMDPEPPTPMAMPDGGPMQPDAGMPMADGAATDDGGDGGGSGDDGGCACATPGSAPTGGAPALLFAVLGAAWLRRRRAR